MRICLVTAFPPSRGGLSEYGFHLARELQQNPLLSLTVLADKVSGAQDDPRGPVVRCWNFDDPASAGRIFHAIRQADPDVVWFNLLFTTFGHHPLAAFRGLTLPLRTRLAGFYTHVTLHHLMDFIDLEGAGVRYPSLYRLAGRLATKMLLSANSVSVLMPAYRSILLQKYGGENVHFRAHGILAQSPEYPEFSRRGNPWQRILAFGKWGTYKRLEPLIEAFQIVSRRHPLAKLVVAGGDHPRAQGYVASLARRYEGPRVQFTGYVPEEKIADLFRNASVAVMPYSSATGASGVAHLACAYGVPIISSDIPEFGHMAEEEGMAIEFYRNGETEDLAEKMIGLLESRAKQKSMAMQNFSAALRMTMPSIIHQYVRQFGREQQARALRPIRWFRRLPPWLARSAAGSAVLRAWMGNYRLRSNMPLFHPNRQRDGHLTTPGDGMNGDGIGGARLDAGGPASARGSDGHGPYHAQERDGSEHGLSFYRPDGDETPNSECHQAGIEEALLPLSLPMGDGHGVDGDGQGGICAPGIGNNGGRGEGTTHPEREI
ncbi:MAG TPA: glycosyltransferase [Terriglobales bacterium]|jgi:glycosyltransferase involved in cell wall biosynthesis